MDLPSILNEIDWLKTEAEAAETVFSGAASALKTVESRRVYYSVDSLRCLLITLILQCERAEKEIEEARQKECREIDAGR